MGAINLSELAKWDRKLGELVKQLPEERRRLLERLAALSKAEVDGAIAASGMRSPGKVQGWQEKQVGSGGGYAAVRPKRGVKGKNSPGAVTGYLERGHAIRSPGGRNRSYRPRIRVPRARAYGMYVTAQTRLQALAAREAEAFAGKLSERLSWK